jgi:hypothetical protein
MGSCCARARTSALESGCIDKANDHDHQGSSGLKVFCFIVYRVLVTAVALWSFSIQIQHEPRAFFGEMRSREF